MAVCFLGIVLLEYLVLIIFQLLSQLLMIMWISCKSLQDLKKRPKYLVTFTVGYNQAKNIDNAMKKVAWQDHAIFHLFYLCLIIYWWFSPLSLDSFQRILPSCSFTTMVGQVSGNALGGPSVQFISAWGNKQNGKAFWQFCIFSSVFGYNKLSSLLKSSPNW